MQDHKESSNDAKRRGIKDGHWLARSDNQNHPDFFGKPSHKEAQREEVLADWLGEERRAPVFADLRPEPADMKTLLKSLLSTVNVGDLQLLDKLKEAWPTLVGDVNARQCAPASIKDTTLNIEVYNSSWLFILRSQQQNIIARRVSEFSNGHLNKVSFTAAGAKPRKK